MIRVLVLIGVILSVGSCSSTQRGHGASNLVNVAIINLVNESNDANYAYLTESVSGAIGLAMDKIFVYERLPAEKCRTVFVELNRLRERIQPVDIQSRANEIDAELVIFGSYKIEKGRRSDSVEIKISVFRADKAETLSTISKKVQISGALFSETEKISSAIVQKIVEYRRQEMRITDQQEAFAAEERKTILSKTSLNITPFIPPIF
ncbi:MAG: hypothetical protein JSR44_00205 [Spirochaetes bacterium]|nr:hypothetical protein [Spirochaetota bacterium]